jgi:hypothetical protein
MLAELWMAKVTAMDIFSLMMPKQEKGLVNAVQTLVWNR